MSFVLEQIRRIDAQFDRLQLANLPATTTGADGENSYGTRAQHELPSRRVLALQASIRALSPSSSDSHTLLPASQIQSLISSLSERRNLGLATVGGDQEKDGYETELEWLLASKATTQVYGLAIETLLSSAERIAYDLVYWDEVLTSRRYTALYSVQISPLRLYDWSSQVWNEAKARASSFNIREAGGDAQESVQQSWRDFYGLVKQVVRERSIQQVNKQVLSPITRLRADIRHKHKKLEKLRVRTANAIGVLLGEGLANESVHGNGLDSPSTQDVQHKWKVSVARNVALMEAVLAKVCDLDVSVDKFDDAVGELTEDDPLYAAELNEEASEDGSAVSVQPQAVAERLSRVLTLALPQYEQSTQRFMHEHGRPSRVVRYWLPVAVGILSSSTILRILINRKADVVQWIEEFGKTVIDFWSNWVVEPARKLIGTIQHDEGSEISIMSKRSLQDDKDSLERMVVDFAIANPENATGSSGTLSEAQIADIRTQVQEGGLAPVLRAYEKDLASPLMGTVRGNLIRALLIQVQKTKVDVEIAMGGIDSMLKSQELLFGLLGLTPGLLITYFAASYARSSISQRRGTKDVPKAGSMMRQLRKIDRILVDGTPTDFGELRYKDQGLLLCEMHVLRRQAQQVMPQDDFKDFCRDADQLCDVREGLLKQKDVKRRIREDYEKYWS